MEDYKTFAKITNWMMTKDGITQKDITKKANLDFNIFAVIIHADPNHLKAVKTSDKVKVQEFNKKYHADMLADVSVQSRDDDPDFHKKAKKKTEKTTAEYANEIAARVEQPPSPSAIRKAFFDQVELLYNLCPDDMTFDIIIKKK